MASDANEHKISSFPGHKIVPLEVGRAMNKTFKLILIDSAKPSASNSRKELSVLVKQHAFSYSDPRDSKQYNGHAYMIFLSYTRL